MNNGLFHRVPPSGPLPSRHLWSGMVVVGALTTLPAQASPVHTQSPQVQLVKYPSVHSRDVSLSTVHAYAVSPSTMHTHSVSASSVHSRSSDLSSWANYVLAGPSVWSTVHAPPVTLSVRETMAQALESPDPTSNPYVDYLIWRRSLDPSRFDDWHPVIGPMLQQLITSTPSSSLALSTPQAGQSVRTQPQPLPSSGTVPGSSLVPGSNPVPGPNPGPELIPTPTPGSGPQTAPGPGSSPGPTPGPQFQPPPPPVPEPSTAVIVLTMFGAAAWWHSRSSRRARDPEE
jgi:hypothetical protein